MARYGDMLEDMVMMLEVMGKTRQRRLKEAQALLDELSNIPNFGNYEIAIDTGDGDSYYLVEDAKSERDAGEIFINDNEDLIKSKDIESFRVRKARKNPAVGTSLGAIALAGLAGFVAGKMK